MLLIIVLLIFLAITTLAYFLLSKKTSVPPKPLILAQEKEEKLKQKKGFPLLSALAVVNRIVPRQFKERISVRLAAAKLSFSADEFLLIKELSVIGLVIIFYPLLRELSPAFYAWPIIAGFFIPELFVKARINRFKKEITKALPDVIDLLALCVGAGLDFMLAIKWVVEKSRPNLLIDELHMLMREINLGKPRKIALADLAKKYDTEGLSTFTRSLVQADRMGTSVADALNMLSEDMRLVRFRKGEQMALKAPLKMLVPLLFFIFPVVAIIIGAPIILEFMQNKSFSF